MYSTEKTLQDSAVSVAPPARPVQKASALGAVTTSKPSTRQRVAEVMDKDDEESGDEDGKGPGMQINSKFVNFSLIGFFF